MSLELRRSPRLSHQMLAEAAACKTCKRSSNVSKRHIVNCSEEYSVKSPARREDFVNSFVKAFTVDRALSGLLNVAVYEHGIYM